MMVIFDVVSQAEGLKLAESGHGKHMLGIGDSMAVQTSLLQLVPVEEHES